MTWRLHNRETGACQVTRNRLPVERLSPSQSARAPRVDLLHAILNLGVCYGMRQLYGSLCNSVHSVTVYYSINRSRSIQNDGVYLYYTLQYYVLQ